MKGKITKSLLISLFLLLLLAPGIVFLIILSNDKLLHIFDNKISDLKDTNVFLEQLMSGHYQLSKEDAKQLVNILVTSYNFSGISTVSEQLIYGYVGFGLVILAMVIIIIGGVLLNFKWQTPRALVIALIIFWIITIVGFAMLAVAQYKYQWNNSRILYLIAKVEKPEDILGEPFNYNFMSKEQFESFIQKIFVKDKASALLEYKTLIFEEFHTPLLKYKQEAHIWISEQGIWWSFLLQSGLVSLIVAFDYTSYASHLVKPTYSFNKRERIVLFGQNWFKRLWTSFKQPTIWNILRISILVITLLLLFEVISIIVEVTNSRLKELYKMLTVFPYSPFDERIITKMPEGVGELEKVKQLFFENILSKAYYDQRLPSIFIMQFLAILGLTFLVIVWSIYFVLIKRISYLSITSIILFYVFFIPLIISSLLLFVYAQTFTNTLLNVVNEYIKAFNKTNQEYQFDIYTSSVFGEKISNTGEWILFALKLIFVIIFSIIIFVLLWEIHKKEEIKKKKNIPSFISHWKRKDKRNKTDKN